VTNDSMSTGEAAMHCNYYYYCEPSCNQFALLMLPLSPLETLLADVT
jgi:hypothetical protein